MIPARRLASHACLLLVLLLLLLPPPQALAGAWTQPEGRGQLILNHFYYSSDAFFDADGQRQSQPRFDKFEINPYLEYGISDDWTIGASLFAHYVTQETRTETGSGVTLSGHSDNVGLGNSEIFARWQLYRGGRAAIALQPLVKLPALYARNRLPKAGSEAFDAELSLLGGYGFDGWGRAHYIDTRLGYRHRFSAGLEDQLRADLKLGLRLNRALSLIPELSATLAFNGNTDTTFTQDGQNDYDLLKLGLAAQYELHDLAPGAFVQLGGFAHVAGRNAGEGYGLLLATGFNF